MDVLAHRPAVKICLPLMAGIVLASRWPVDTAMLFEIMLVLTASTVGIALLRRNGRSPLHAIISFLLVVLIGASKIEIDDSRGNADNILHYLRPDTVSVITGAITDQPRLIRQSTRFAIEAESMMVGGTYHEVTGGILVAVLDTSIAPYSWDSLTYGTRVVVAGELFPPPVPRNPGAFDQRTYLQLNGIYARLNVRSWRDLTVRQPASFSPLARWVYPVRRSISTAIDRFFDGEVASFLKGLVIGERGEIPFEVRTAFINSGVMHILAVSGLHVAMVTVLLLGGFSLFRIPERIGMVLTMALLVYYLFLTGAAASVARSVLMAIVFLGGKLSAQRTDMYNTLALSAVGILLVDAKQLFQPGFQLSFIAVFALVYLYPRLYRLKDRLPERFARRKHVEVLFASIAVSFAAGIGTLPCTALYFGKISIVSFVANILIVPLSNIILAMGMLTVAISYCSSWIGAVYAELTNLLTLLLLKLVDWFGNAPYAYVHAHYSLVDVLITYGVLGLAMQLANKKLRRWSVLGVMLLANAWLWWIIVPASAPKMRVTFLDVGQGDAIFIELPDGKNLLIDGGPRTQNTDAGARFIAPYLQYRGIGTIHTIMLSHPHSDHLGGIPFLLRNFRIEKIIDAGSAGRSFLEREFASLIDSLRIEHSVFSAGMKLEKTTQVRMYCLYPAVRNIQSIRDPHANLNNESLVIRLLFGSTSLLLMGDAEREVEQQVSGAFGSFLRSDIIKVGHHGSLTSSSSGLLEMVDPGRAVISVGAKNKFHHPSPEVLQRYVERSCLSYRTDESGAIIMESDGREWTLVDWR